MGIKCLDFISGGGDFNPYSKTGRVGVKGQGFDRFYPLRGGTLKLCLSSRKKSMANEKKKAWKGIYKMD